MGWDWAEILSLASHSGKFWGLPHIAPISSMVKDGCVTAFQKSTQSSDENALPIQNGSSLKGWAFG